MLQVSFISHELVASYFGFFSIRLGGIRKNPFFFAFETSLCIFSPLRASFCCHQFLKLPTIFIIMQKNNLYDLTKSCEGERERKRLRERGRGIDQYCGGRALCDIIKGMNYLEHLNNFFASQISHLLLLKTAQLFLVQNCPKRRKKSAHHQIHFTNSWYSSSGITATKLQVQWSGTI